MHGRDLRLVGLGLLLVGSGCEKPRVVEPQKPVVTFVEARPVSGERAEARPAYLAVIRGDTEVDLSFKVSGFLDLIGPSPGTDWREGAEVKKGQVLARLAQAEFKSSVDSAHAKAELDEKNLQRGKELNASGAISKQEFDVTKANAEASTATLAQAEQALRDSTLLAPFDGHVLGRNAHTGETVTAGKALLRFGDLHQMSIELAVPDTVVNRVKVGQQIPLKITTLEDAPFTGTVSEVGVAAQQSTRLFRAVIKVPNPDGRIRSGMTASVALGETGPPLADAVMVPLSALVAPAGADERVAVFVVDGNGGVEERPVATGEILESSIVVTDGLKAGERVVTAGAGTLFHGAQVVARPVRAP